MNQHSISQVLVMAHGWAYNHHFFDSFLATLTPEIQQHTLLVCLEAGYFPEQSVEGLMIYTEGEWTHHPTETLHSLVLAHANAPWLGLGHSLGFSKLLEFSVRWHSLISLHGFTHFVSNDKHKVGIPARVLARMFQKAEQNMPAVLSDFHGRCQHEPDWGTLNEQALLTDLKNMGTLDCSSQLTQILEHGTNLHVFNSNEDCIVPIQLTQACFEAALSRQGHILCNVAAQHGEFASTPARYTDSLLPILSQR